MTQTASQPQVIENILPIINVPGLGPAILIPTTKSIKFAEGVDLKTALDAFNEQITASAALVATLETRLADMTAWLSENFGYVEQRHETGGTYLTPLFTQLIKTPTGEGELP